MQALRKGDKVFSREQVAGYKKKLERDRQRLAEKGAGKKRENFCFLSREQEFKGLSPQTISRIIFLNTFADFADNKLIFRNGRPIHRRDLPKVCDFLEVHSKAFGEKQARNILLSRPTGL